MLLIWYFSVFIESKTDVVYYSFWGITDVRNCLLIKSNYILFTLFQFVTDTMLAATLVSG